MQNIALETQTKGKKNDFPVEINLDFKESHFEEKEEDFVLDGVNEIDVFKDNDSDDIYETNIDFDSDDTDTIKAMSDSYNYYQHMLDQYPICTKEEEIEYLKKAQNGDMEARNELILRNQRLVICIAKKYRGVSDFDFMDLISEGNLGLVRAIEKFDINKNTKFSTYAMYWIRQAIMRAIENRGDAFRLPAHVYRSYVRARVSATEECAKTGESVSWNAIKKYLEKEPISLECLEAICNYYNFKYHSVRFDSKIKNGEDEDTEMSEIISANVSDINPEEMMEIQVRKETIENVLLTGLNEKERDIIRMRFGFDGPIMTLEQIGNKYNVTRERIRQIESKAIKKLRNPKYKRLLSEFRPNY